MRLLHTSDWHIGLTHDGLSRNEDHVYFFDWLKNYIKKSFIDILVVSGDIFDQSQPSAESLRIYYGFLSEIIKETKLKKIIIIGGNHDSAARLDAPAEILSALNIFTIGGIKSNIFENMEELLCPIVNDDNEVEIVVAAVPFLHEYKLGIKSILVSETEIRKEFQEKLGQFYLSLAETARKKWPNAVLVATGHLFCEGAEKDDAPQDVHFVGSIGGLSAKIFPDLYEYIALGHIHKSYRVANSKAYYSGSPIMFSAKDANLKKSINIAHFNKEKLVEVEKIELPLLRKIINFSGTLDEFEKWIDKLTWETKYAPLLILNIQLTEYNSSIQIEINNKINVRFKNEIQLIQKNKAIENLIPKILSVKQELIIINDDLEKNNIKEEIISLKELNPEDVFRKICIQNSVNIDDQLIIAFNSLVQEIEREDLHEIN